MVYRDCAEATIEWDETDKIASITWNGAYVEGEAYRSILTSLAELMEEKKVSRLLADTRRSKVVTAADQEWVNTVWTPRAAKAGMKYTALLVPQSVVAKLSLDRMRSKYTTPGGGGVIYCTDIDEAKAWLRSSPR